jgi:predicted RNase H-like HicB family nuclease
LTWHAKRYQGTARHGDSQDRRSTAAHHHDLELAEALVPVRLTMPMARTSRSAQTDSANDERTPMGRGFDVIIESDSEGYFVASVPTLNGRHTQAKSLDELMERVKEAITLCLDVEGPTPDSLDFVGVQRIRVA